MSDEQKNRNQLILELNELRRKLSEAESRVADQVAAAMQQEILKEELRKSRNEMEQRLNSFFKGSTAGLVLLDRELRFIQINDTLADMNGVPAEAHIGKAMVEVVPELASTVEPIMRKVLATGEPVLNIEIAGETLSWPGIHRHWLESFFPIPGTDGTPEGVGAIVVEITGRKQAEEALKNSRAFLDAVIEQSPVSMWISDGTGNLIRTNQALRDRLCVTDEELVGKYNILNDNLVEDQGLMPLVREVFEHGRKVRFTIEYDTSQVKNLKLARFARATFDVTISAVLDSNGNITNAIIQHLDISEQKQAEEEKVKLQAQLRQAQKMESLGTLAGGVAHDFNNMLGVILGHSEMAMDEVDSSQPLYVGLQEIHKAARRSADLTRQLLAFARKQTASPKVLNLNETVESVLKMLKRLIGENIELAWLPDENLWPVKIDPSQIDQILANLSVNARDAIKGVGKLTIRTENTIFDETYRLPDTWFVPGEYVVLTLSDDGTGMDEETRDRIFEPFFTTKEVGKGTGLGLATVYGIVKQNNGFIDVYSEPDQGTTFKIYLPRHAGQADEELKPNALKTLKGIGETVLLVEDEPAILQMTQTMLQRMGYNVLAASTPGEAMRLAEENTGNIHLLITDVIMPEMNGRDLTAKLLSLYPNLKSLFMSGYTADVIARQGVLDVGVNFIQKPFSTKAMAEKVREVLGD